MSVSQVFSDIINRVCGWHIKKTLISSNKYYAIIFPFFGVNFTFKINFSENTTAKKSK